MQLKQLGLSLVLAGMLSTHAYASEAVIEAAPLAAAPVNAVTQDDLVALFGAEEAGKPMQVATLSDTEMRETEGAYWLNIAGGFVGGASGAYGYMTSAAYNRNASSSTVAWGLTKSIVGGAAWGAYRPAQSIGGALGKLSFSAGRGAVVGYGSGRGWW